MVFVLLCILVVLILQYLKLKEISKMLQENSKQTELTKPPKARGSFVVKRFEERIKQALYE